MMIVKDFKIHFFVFISTFIMLFSSLGITPRFPEIGLDQSWQQALCDATDKGRVFGEDVVFTYGPLHQVATHQVSNNLSPFVIGRLVFGIAWLCIGLLFCINFGAVAGSILLAGIIVLNARTGWPEAQSDVMIYLLACLFSINGFYILTSKNSLSLVSITLLLLSGVGVAVSPLVKLSFLTSTLPSLLGVFAISIVRLCLEKSFRSFVSVSLLMCIPILSLILIWDYTTKSNFQSLLVFFGGLNLDIVKSYATAMSTSPRYGTAALEISLYFFSFISLGIIFVSLNLNHFFGRFFDNKIRFLSSIVFLLTFAAIAWVIFKVGFVRHNTQAITPGLILVGLWFVVISLNWKILFQLIKDKTDILILPGLISPLLIGFLIAVANGYLPSIKKGSVEYLINLPKTLYSTFTPTGLDSLRNSRKNVLINLSSEIENFKIDDISNPKVDIFPWDISDVLANGLNYRPRPIPQSYSAYTKNLQIANLQHFQNSKSRPDYVILRLSDIDERLPIGLDSMSLRFIFSNYELSHKGTRDSLVFKSTHSDKREIIQETIKGEWHWQRVGNLLFESNSIPINSPNSFIWLTSELEPSLLNRLLAFFFKPFPTLIEYLDESGSVVHSSRIIPTAINSILIFPVISNNDDLFRVPNTQIQQVRLASRFFIQPFVKSTYKVEFTKPPEFTSNRNIMSFE